MSLQPEAGVEIMPQPEIPIAPTQRSPLSLLRIGMTGLTLAMAPAMMAESAQAHPQPEGTQATSPVTNFYRAEERKVEQSLKRKIIHGKAVPIYEGDVRWTEVDRGIRAEFTYKNSCPIVEKVKNKQGKKVSRYFEVTPGSTNKYQIHVDVIDPSASRTPGSSRKSKGGISEYQVAIHENVTPVIQQKRGKTKCRKIGATHDVGTKFINVLSEGKRYVEQAETAKKLEEVKTVQEFAEAMQGYLNQYNLKLNVEKGDVAKVLQNYTNTHLRDADIGVLRKFGFAFINGFSKYPPELIARLGIKNVSVVNELMEDGYSPRAVADITNGGLVFSLHNIKKEYLEDVIHHEVGHIITYDLFNWYKGDNGAWIALNPPGTQYTGGRGDCRIGDVVCQGELSKASSKGYITKYSTTSIQEDQAEIFAFMMCQDTSKTHYYSNEPSIVQKIQFLKQSLAQKYTIFNDEYFAQINPKPNCYA